VHLQTTNTTGYRTFLDVRGREWEVWMVHPSSIERRKMERRSPVENAVHLIEQRVLGDRRAHIGSRGAVASEFSAGWLCFASSGEKRRLVPVPTNWMSANDAQVAEWCRIAKRVMKCGPEWDPADDRETELPKTNETSSRSGSKRQRQTETPAEDRRDAKKG
jgi:hypothetical protein